MIILIQDPLEQDLKVNWSQYFVIHTANVRVHIALMTPWMIEGIHIH